MMDTATVGRAFDILKKSLKNFKKVLDIERGNVYNT